MGKVLLVDCHRDSLAELEKALMAAGHEVIVAPSGGFALTMLEWNRPDVIVSRSISADMDGYELCAIVKSDPTTKSLPFVLLASPTEPASPAANHAAVDLLLSGDLGVSMIVARVGILLLRDSIARVRRPRSPEEPTPDGKTPVEVGERSLQGSLAVMDVMEVIQVVSAGRKTGRLELSLRTGVGSIVIDGGQVVHAEYGGLSGEAAFAALVTASQRERGGSFCFNPVQRSRALDGPKTIQKSVAQLLLSIAAEIDESGPTVTHRGDARTSPTHASER